MKCCNCPGLNRSYLACTLGVRHIFFINVEVNCQVGERLLVKLAEKEAAYAYAMAAQAQPIEAYAHMI